jgi:hypothetical protein
LSLPSFVSQVLEDDSAQPNRFEDAIQYLVLDPAYDFLKEMVISSEPDLSQRHQGISDAVLPGDFHFLASMPWEEPQLRQ